MPTNLGENPEYSGNGPSECLGDIPNKIPREFSKKCGNWQF